MKLRHTQSRKGRRGHKWFPSVERRRALQMSAMQALVAAVVLGARGGRR